MEYKEAIKELRAFANEPIDSSTLDTKKALELRIAVRAVLKTMDDDGNVIRNIHIHGDGSAVKKTLSVGTVYPRPTTIREQITDFIREAGEAGRNETEIYRKFKKVFKELQQLQAKSYGMVSYTQDSKGDYIFYYQADTGLQFNETKGGRLPTGHKWLGTSW